MKDPRAVKPRNLAVAGRNLAVAWGDGHESYFPFDDLRRHCPCATCRSRRAAAPESGPLRVMDSPRYGELSIRSLVPVGAYAVQIGWSDGHDSGIYSFESLRDECPCAECGHGS
jgi:DUF971 family protein